MTHDPVGDPADDWGPLVDHHCHGLVLEDLDRSGFEALMNEAAHASPLGTTLFDSMLGLAIRRHCAPVLDLEPLAPADDYLERRAELGAAEVNRPLPGRRRHRHLPRRHGAGLRRTGRRA